MHEFDINGALSHNIINPRHLGYVGKGLTYGPYPLPICFVDIIMSIVIADFM